jgi:hypothetical protein
MQKAIELALTKLKEQEAKVIETKKVINGMCGLAGQPPMFADAELMNQSSPTGIRSDQYYGQALTSVVRQILKDRKATGLGAMSVADIHKAMVKGGYEFETANTDNAKRSLRISLTKNSAVFHKLPNGDYGLREWYPNVKDAKPKAADAIVEPGKQDNATQEEVEREAEVFDFEAKEKESSEKASA